MRALLIFFIGLGFVSAKRVPGKPREYSAEEIELLQRFSTVIDDRRIALEEAKYSETDLKIGPRKFCV